MVAFIDAHREEYGIEPICAQLPMAPSRYYEHKARQADPSRLPPRLQRERALEGQIRRVWDENFQVYGVRKTWRALKREDIEVARCTVARLMARLGLRGAVRGRAFKTTTVSDAAMERPGRSGQAQLRHRAARRPVGVGPDLRYAQPTTPARMGVELLEHVWNA
jgi:putative transposase